MKNSTFRPATLLSALFLFLRSPMADAQQREIVDPFFSHDAKKIAYVVGLFTVVKADPSSLTVNSAELWTANADGSNARRLTSGSIDGNARWSPDGKQIAFLRKGDVWLINSDGSGLRQITKTPQAKERSPEFSNDGKILFFVRSEQINLADGLAGQQPLTIDGSGEVIAYSLVSNQERKHFESMDNVKLVIPNRADANELFLYYHYYDPKVKTKYGNGALTDMVLAAAKLDGSGRRVIHRLTQNSQSQVQQIRATLEGPLLVTKKTAEDGDTYTDLFLTTKTGTKEIKEGQFTFNDISSDGKLITGVGPIFREENGVRKYDLSIKIKNVVSNETISLDKSTLLDQRTLITTPTTIVPGVAKPQAPKEPPSKAREHFDKGEKAFAVTGYGEAIDEYSEAIRLYPAYSAAHYKRGVSYFKRFDYDEAIADFNAAIKINPVYSEAYLARGAVYEAQGENKQALSDYTDAIVYSEHPAEGYKKRGALCRKMGLIQAAQEDEAAALEYADEESNVS